MTAKNSKLDILGESHIPSDLLTPSLGSNYGLDGFEDVQYGMGVLEGVLDPEHMEAPALPTGIQLASSSAEEMDLSELMEDRVPLTDLNWLDPSQLQDPERLPKIPISIPELEEAWGRSTDGIRVWQRDLDGANWEKSLVEQPQKTSKLTPDHIRRVVSQAIRRSVRGHDLQTILREASDSVGQESLKLAPFLKPMQEEHGLAGRVFIRASAYPNWGTGKWAQEAKKYASRARYIVVSEKEIQGATWIENGRCKYTSKIAVTQVPWQEALEYYKPLLESTGRKVASGDPKKSLRAAFLSIPEKKKVSSENLPVHIAPSQRIGLKQAREEFTSFQPEKVVYDPSVARLAELQKRVSLKISQMVRDNLIPDSARVEILASGKTPEAMLRSAAFIAAQVKAGTYQDSNKAQHRAVELESRRAESRKAESQGASERISRDSEKIRQAQEIERSRTLVAHWINSRFVSKDEVQSLYSELRDYRKVVAELKPKVTQIVTRIRADEYRDPNRALEATQEVFENRVESRIQREARTNKEVAEEIARRQEAASMASREKKHLYQKAAKVQEQIDRGLKGKVLRSFFSRAVPEGDAKEVLRILGSSVQEAFKDVVVEKKSYDQTQFTRFTAEKKAKSVLAGQVLKASNWLRKTMSEGFAGKDLEDLIDNRISASLKQASAEDFQNLRAQHEGASGFLYVDAEAYASPSGITGCENGALRHRANQIPTLLEMPRCATCSVVRVLEDGTRKCGVYNKVLANLDSEEESSRVQEAKLANIRASNMNDAELTASLFSPSYDPSEFGLQNDNLEGIELDLPENEKIADITFGGWDF